MSAQPDDGQRGAEIMPFRAPPDDADPAALLAVPDSPASRAEDGQGAAHPANAARTGEAAVARVIYADLTAAATRRDIIPVALQRGNLRDTIEAFAGLQWHRARLHGLRLPLYVLAYLFWAIVGVARLAAALLSWWWLAEQGQLRSDAVVTGNSAEWRRLHKEAKETRRIRGLVLAVAAAVLAGGCAWLAVAGPWLAQAAVCVVAVAGLARAGRPDGHQIVAPAVVPPDYSPPTHEIISRALGSLNIAQINAALKPDRDGRATGIRFVSDVYRDGPGWACQLDLPHGVSVSTILGRREDFASGLRKPLSATWPEGVPQEHPGRMDLWVGFQDISKAKPSPGPLVKARTTDLFDSLPFGTSPRGRMISVPMFEMNWIIGAAPGQGKTAAVRQLACGTALDVLADIWIAELSGKGDLEPLAKVCHRYCSGMDDESIAYAAESARLLRNEVEQRQAAFRKLKADGRLPKDGKVTRELASQFKELRPLLAVFDEVQNLLTDKQYGEQAAEDLAYVIRVGRAYGIIAVLSTQRPDAKIIPTAITGLVIGRCCLMVPDQPANDVVLGTSSYRRGYDATVFRPKLDAGLCWLKGSEEGTPQVCRTFYIDLPTTEKIAARARDLRDRAEVLTGYALGEAAGLTVPRDVLADVLAVFGDAPGLHWDELADRLAARWPDRWADVTGDAMSAQCRKLGVPSVMVSRDGDKARGCRRIAVERESAR
jgi:S-DNA-T family DNA segregation ATPase FtsK/SpoIIIE